MNKLRTLHAGDERPPESKPASPEGPDEEARGRRGSPIWMRDMDPLKDHCNKFAQHTTGCCFEPSEPGVSRRTTESSPTKTSSSEPDVKVS